jgi:hypothetical protein
MNQLDVLSLPANRDTLFLAEAAGWLHDYRKCSDVHLAKQAHKQAQPTASTGVLETIAQKHSALARVKLDFLGLHASSVLTELLEKDTRKKSLPGQYLQRCHYTSHFDKQDPDGGKQIHPGTKISSPFGFEQNVPPNLTDEVWKLPWNLLENYSTNQAEKRKSLRKQVRALFSRTVADTRRPINEVDLWNWGLMAGAFYKSALVGVLLSGVQPAPNDLRWRLLSVNHNGLDFLINVARIPDLLARQQLAEDGLNKVCHLLEFTYPLGTEVYRDERGSIFVVPDLPDLLERTDQSGKNLALLISQEFAQGALENDPRRRLAGEMTVHLKLEDNPWYGQDPKPVGSSKDELPQISRLLDQRPDSVPDVEEITGSWQEQKPADICSVCGLRPQGPVRKALERRVCDICEERRADRSRQWAISESESNTTVWTDEVADINGRLALLVGRFELAGWLNGNLLNTLFLIAPPGPQSAGQQSKPKSPSFSRLHRIWETTGRFWKQVREHTLKELLAKRLRLRIDLASLPDLGPFHVYDLELGATDLSLVWVPREHGGYLISADDLGYIARRLNANPDVYSDPAKAAAFVQDHLQKRFVEAGRQPVLRNPDERTRNGKLNLLAKNRLSHVQQEQSRYSAAIPLLAEPRTFMMLLPANDALHVADHIKGKYENEMGKVRDRLPIHLGLIFAERRTPVRALLEAGRAMLDDQPRQESWEIESVNIETNSGRGQFNQAVVLQLARDGRQLLWRIPTKMGDGTTDDLWYPYLFLETNGDDLKANSAARRAKCLEWRGEDGEVQKRWVVHAGGLQARENVSISPSTFDFEFLDSAGRRFEVYYDSNGRRPRSTRPFYLEDLDRLKKLWGCVKELHGTQRHQVVRTIESTREAWHGQEQNEQASQDAVFRQFVSDTLAGAAWPKDKSWDVSSQECKDLVQAGISGELADLAELYMEILKEK